MLALAVLQGARGLIPGLFIVCNHNATVCNIMINKSPGLHDGRPVGPLARALFRPLSNALSGGHFAPRGRISGRFCRPKGTNLFNMNAVINYKAPRRGLAVSFKQLPGHRTHAGYGREGRRPPRPNPKRR